jgi:tRNA-specific 2-thiouridylase
MKKQKVMIGLSGGVDSAVAALLLLQQGYEVIGGFMRNWDSIANNDVLGNPTLDDDQCSQEKDYDDALAVATHLGIPLYRVDFVKEYWDHVFQYFLDEYAKGRTPNPDIFCNKYIKLDAFYHFALSHQCDLIAMGHYAKRLTHMDGTYSLSLAKDDDKDQTYFLSQMSQHQLAKTLFPLSDLTKPDVRKIALETKIPVATKKDSTGVCFIGERHFKEFLKNYIPAQKGTIIDIDTNAILGDHEGVYYYTIGQRKGLGIGGSKALGNDKWFVVKKDVKKNILYVSSGEDNPHLLADHVTVSTLNWIGNVPIIGATYVARFRHRQTLQPVVIQSLSDKTMTLVFPTPYKALTPGQAAVLYDDEICLGGGLIDDVFFKGNKVN